MWDIKITKGWDKRWDILWEETWDTMMGKNVGYQNCLFCGKKRGIL